MSRVYIRGLGAVSPAGWGVPDLLTAINANRPLETSALVRPGWNKPLQVRVVPAPATRCPALTHPRLRRASPLAQHVVAAALEALGEDAERVRSGKLRLGVIVTTMTGCVNYSRRFYEEALKDPHTASPLLFPETVFNAPASHLAAYFDAPCPNYTLVGDDGTFVQGLALAAQWLAMDRADGCVIIGAEEMDWIAADAVGLFESDAFFAVGAGALYLNAQSSDSARVELECVTDAFPYTQNQDRLTAARKMLAQISLQSNATLAYDPAPVLGMGFNASTAWRCVAACASIEKGKIGSANVAVTGINQQAIGARFTEVQNA